MRAGVPDDGDRFRRPERRRKRSFASVAFPSRIEAARGSGYKAEDHLLKMNLEQKNKINDDLLRPVLQTSGWFYAIIVVLGAVILAGLASWMYQMSHGLAVAGIRFPVYWAFYITNFVFWIGISHAGTLISAILRLVNATWRRPVTRCAEVITVFALMIGAMFPIIHLGRPWLFFWLIPYPSERQIWPNLRSPLAWDFFAISTYLTGSTLFLLLPIIPDFALMRDQMTGWRKRIYGILA